MVVVYLTLRLSIHAPRNSDDEDCILDHEPEALREGAHLASKRTGGCLYYNPPGGEHEGVTHTWEGAGFSRDARWHLRQHVQHQTAGTEQEHDCNAARSMVEGRVSGEHVNQCADGEAGGVNAVAAAEETKAAAAMIKHEQATKRGIRGSSSVRERRNAHSSDRQATDDTQEAEVDAGPCDSDGVGLDDQGASSPLDLDPTLPAEGGRDDQSRNNKRERRVDSGNGLGSRKRPRQHKAAEEDLDDVLNTDVDLGDTGRDSRRKKPNGLKGRGGDHVEGGSEVGCLWRRRWPCLVRCASCQSNCVQATPRILFRPQSRHFFVLQIMQNVSPYVAVRAMVQVNSSRD